jgi:hypothetical protein
MTRETRNARPPILQRRENCQRFYQNEHTKIYFIYRLAAPSRKMQGYVDCLRHASSTTSVKPT